MANRLLTRGDDFGSAEAANQGIYRCVTQGIVRNVGVMVPGPAFRAGVPMLLELQRVADIGLHITLNAEWDNIKWGPVSPDAPSLTDESGKFTASPHRLGERGFDLEEAEREILTQLGILKSAGVRVDYIDEHMGVGQLPGLRVIIQDIAARAGLVYGEGIPYVPLSPALVADVQAVAGPAALTVGHPALDSAETQAWIHPGLQPGQIARERQADVDLLTDRQLKSDLANAGIEVIRFTDR